MYHVRGGSGGGGARACALGRRLRAVRAPADPLPPTHSSRFDSGSRVEGALSAEAAWRARTGPAAPPPLPLPPASRPPPPPPPPLLQRTACSRTRPHSWLDCPWAHPQEKARRRAPTAHRGESCPDYRRAGACALGTACPLAHGVFESWLHPSRYKTQVGELGDGGRGGGGASGAPPAFGRGGVHHVGPPGGGSGVGGGPEALGRPRSHPGRRAAPVRAGGPARTLPDPHRGLLARDGRGGGAHSPRGAAAAPPGRG
jgi:hypothetical protein